MAGSRWRIRASVLKIAASTAAVASSASLSSDEYSVSSPSSSSAAASPYCARTVLRQRGRYAGQSARFLSSCPRLRASKAAANSGSTRSPASRPEPAGSSSNSWWAMLSGLKRFKSPTFGKFATALGRIDLELRERVAIRSEHAQTRLDSSSARARPRRPRQLAHLANASQRLATIRAEPASILQTHRSDS